MTQQPFSRPGAIDLSALKRPAAPSPAPAAPGGAGGTAGSPGGSYSLTVTEENFQGVVESSMNAAVLLVFFSRSRMPESGQLADDLATLSGEFEGRFLVGLVDIDATPSIAQAMQIQSVPLVVAVVDGRPMPLFQDVVPLDQLRDALTQVGQQLTAQGITGRHQPRSAAPAAGAGAGDAGTDEPQADPRYAAAQDALGDGDVDRAVAEYQKLLDANPADAEAAAGLAMARLLQRTQGVDPAQAVADADAHPEDLDAQVMAADVDLLGGDATAAFDRLIAAVRRTSGDERNRVREHLVGLFGAVGNDDPRVLKARQGLASALF